MINSKTDAQAFTVSSELVLKSLVRGGVGELPLTVRERDQVGLSCADKWVKTGQEKRQPSCRRK